MPTKMSKIETAIRIALAFNEAFNRQDVAGMVKLLSNDCVFETSTPAPDGETYTGTEALEQYLHNFFRQSPQAHIQIEDIYGFGHRCNMHWRYTWVDEAGNQQQVRGIDIFQEKDGLICKKLAYVKSSYGY
ncbi:MAG: nuclear transport factor 2 family protein [Anaerolineae bacterium]|nr:nuclear transport factor 2 family protein [Anaerolineae bacterium]